MTYVPVDVPAFGGLNVSDDAEDSRGALDIQNVSLHQPSASRLTNRPGYTTYGSTDLSLATACCKYSTSSVVVGESGALRLMASSGSATSSNTSLTASSYPWGMVRFGHPGSTVPTFTNPSFASATTGWTANDSTITRDTSIVDSDSASGRWDNTGASDVLNSSSDSLVTALSGTFMAGVQYTITFRAKASASPAYALRAYLSSDTGQYQDLNITTSWATYSLTVTPAVTTSSASLWLICAPGAPNCYYNVDKFECELPGSFYAADSKNMVRYDTTNSVFETFTVGTKKANETSFVYGRTAPIPNTVAVQPVDNRLVACGFSNATDGPRGVAHVSATADGVFFSQPDAPEKWDETDYVLLSPGDGETIRAACSWGNNLFVFKQTKFFVFYGNSTDSGGGSVFNYRAVEDAFGGADGPIYQGQVVSAPDGVYVITETGVWRTTGGQPQLVSKELTPLFNNGVSTLNYQGTGYNTIAPANLLGTGGSFFHEGAVYFCVTWDGSTAGWLVYTGHWSIYKYADTPVVGASSGGGIYFPSGSSTTGRKGLLLVGGTATTDNGTAISWYYTAPYSDLGSRAEKRIRQTELHGTGTVSLKWARDLQTHGYPRSVTMLNGRGIDRTAVRGETLSFKLSGSGAFSVNRVVPFVADQRVVGAAT